MSLMSDIGTAVKAKLDLKVDKVSGKQLSTEDYSTSEKAKLLGIEVGAQVNTVTSVAGRTNAVVLTKADVGLGSVDNTSDASKPVSTATQAALNAKVNNTQVLTDVPAGAVFTDTVYVHPTTDGSLHVPATSTTNNGKVLTAGATAGSLSWTTPSATDATKLPLSGGDMTGTIREAYVAMPANDIAVSTASVFGKTISGSTTLTVSSVPSTGKVSGFTLELTNGGSAALTWWSGIKWTGGNAPILTASGLDILEFYTRDGGTTWRGFVSSKDNK